MKLRLSVFFSISAAMIAMGVCLGAQTGPSKPSRTPETITEQLLTSDRVRAPGWWPTKGTFARNEFVGPAKCAKCHADIAETQNPSAMMLTASLAADSGHLQANALEYRLGPYLYRASVKGGIAHYSVSNGRQTIAGPLSWSFGIRMGQSYFFDYKGRTYLVPLTYYPERKSFGFTVDQPHSVPTSLPKAIGRVLSNEQIRGCFDCHTTASTTSEHFDPNQSIPGVTCEACHGPGANHLAAVAAGLTAQGITMILNPQQFNPVKAIDFCGACHRTWWDVVLDNGTGKQALRFQPYRIENSRCWGKGDRRITCVACHDPHKPLVREAGAYDDRCLSCHLNSRDAKPAADHPGAACPTATKNCVTCHMPQLEIAEVPVKFTDHQIRIVRPGEPIPD